MKRRWTGLFTRPTERTSDGATFDEDNDIGLDSGAIQPMRSVLLGEASSGTPVRRTDSLSRRLVSLGLGRPTAPDRAVGRVEVGPPGPDPESGTEWNLPDPDDGSTGRRPVRSRLSWLPPVHVLAVAVAATVVVAVVITLAVNSLNHASSRKDVSKDGRGSPQASATVTSTPGDYGAVGPGPTDSARPDPSPSSSPTQSGSPAQPPGDTGPRNPPPALRRAALYSVPAQVHADGPSGQRVSTMLGSTAFTDSTSMFIGCSGGPATLTYRLDGAGVRLTTTAGLAGDATPGDLVARVILAGDGRTLADVTVSLDRQASINIDLTGVRSLVVSAQRVSGSCGAGGQPYGALGNAQLVRKA